MKMIKQYIKVITPESEYKVFASRIENIARVCYQSAGKDVTSKFIRSLIKSGHEAMIEHSSLSISFITDRATANALVRHRHCSFAQESTHYINYAKKYGDLTCIRQVAIEDQETFESMLYDIESDYIKLSNEKSKAKRALLPLAFKTELVITTNLSEWRSILKRRTSKKAHPQMQDIMLKVLDWFKQELPIFVEDIDAER
jgi:thymidylate synthase (FAD)